MNFNKSTIVHLLHIIIIGGLFLYVGIVGNALPLIIFPILLYLGIFVILYHIYSAYKHLMAGKSAWVNYIHIFLVGPLLIYIGHTGKDTERKYYEMLLMLGFASIGYHGYYLFAE
jgi:hypothetical protein